MKALRVEDHGIAVRDVEKPHPGPEAIVRVTLSGVCNTDLEISRGYAGFQGTLGHEFVGVVESLAEARTSATAAERTLKEEPSLAVGLLPTALQAGQRVVGEINAGCGRCNLCLAGDARHCAHRTVLGIVGRDGAHAEFLRLPSRNLHVVPGEVPDEHAVFTEPLAAACGILERTAITEDTRVAVIGDGKLGLLCAQVLALTGAPVLLVGKHSEKLSIASRRGVETASIEKAQNRGREFDVVVEASGSASGFALALELLHPRGVLVLKSTFHGSAEIDAARIVVDEISVVGSRCGQFEPALQLLQQNSIDVQSLISEEYALEDGVHAMQRAAEPGVLKVLLRP
ncbi:MAG: alcohol dehydrogenase catalytic domain-containing protein [Pyrinomonadaceae bacterium]